MVENHLCVLSGFSIRRLTQFQQSLGFQKGIGVPLKPAGVPCEVDQKAVQDLPEIGSRWQVRDSNLADSRQFMTDFIRKIWIFQDSFSSSWAASLKVIALAQGSHLKEPLLGRLLLGLEVSRFDLLIARFGKVR